MIEQVSKNTNIVINNPTYILCLATGFPIPTITWLKDGAPIDLYSDVLLNIRIDIFEFDVRNVSSGFMTLCSGSIEQFLNRNTEISPSDIMELGGLGVVSFLRFYNVERNDTARYSCVAVNELPQTTQLRNVSDPVQLTVLGKLSLTMQHSKHSTMYVKYIHVLHNVHLPSLHTHTHTHTHRVS